MRLLDRLEKALSSGDRQLAQEIAGLIHGAEGMMDVFDSMYEELDDARKELEAAFYEVAGRNARLVVPPGRADGDPRGLHRSILHVARSAPSAVQRRLSSAAMYVNRGITRVDPQSAGGEDVSGTLDSDDLLDFNSDEQLTQIEVVAGVLDDLKNVWEGVGDVSRHLGYAYDALETGVNHVYEEHLIIPRDMLFTPEFENMIEMLQELEFEVIDEMKPHVISAKKYVQQAQRRIP